MACCWLITVAKLIADLQNRKQFGFHLDQEGRGPEVGKGRYKQANHSSGGSMIFERGFQLLAKLLSEGFYIRL